MSLPHRLSRLAWLVLLPLAATWPMARRRSKRPSARGGQRAIPASRCRPIAEPGDGAPRWAGAGHREYKRGPFDELRYEIKLLDAQGNKQRLLVDAAELAAPSSTAARTMPKQCLMTALAAYLAQLKLPAGQYISDVKS